MDDNVISMIYMPVLLGISMNYVFRELLPIRRLQRHKLWAALASVLAAILMMISVVFLPKTDFLLQIVLCFALYFVPAILITRKNPAFHCVCATFFATSLTLTRRFFFCWLETVTQRTTYAYVLPIAIFAITVILQARFSVSSDDCKLSETCSKKSCGDVILLFLFAFIADYMFRVYMIGSKLQNNGELLLLFLLWFISFLFWQSFITGKQPEPFVVQYDEGLTPEMRIERRFNYYATQAKYLEEFRSFRHDYKNQLTTLKALLERGEYARAEEFLSALTVKFEDMRKNTPNYSDNMLVDAVLQHMAGRCAASHITFEASVVVGNELPLTDLDLSAVFCNIADNAFEAAEKSGAPVPIVRFLSSRREKWLIVTAENSYNGVLKTDPETDELCTTKPESRCHGFGVKNIKRIVEAVPGASVRIEQLPAAEESPENGAIFRISLIFPR